jgi:sigma-B regulation protein RsbU (phosphoserine phosphatase)
VIETGHTSNERLRRLESVADAALSELDADALLPELLDRLRQVLDVDTAAVMLLDAHAQHLVTAAAKGIEDELRLGFRIAVGRGFVGRVAARRRAVAIVDVSASDIASPVLRGIGVKSVLGVPMFAAGELIGVIHVGTTQRRAFTADDIQLLQLAADRAAVASQTRLNRIDREAALALQRGLLPTRLPTVPGVELAARYVPGHDTGVGGDWYDVFGLPDGSLGVVVGDVSGHGLRAAVIMGRLRSALRAYALECADPADALSRLDRKIQHFEAGNLATALYAMMTPDRSELTISLAGHPPPILATADGSRQLLSLPADLPLGTGTTSTRRRNTTVWIPAEALLVCYSDGLVESRRAPIALGLDRLLGAVEAIPAEAACDAIMSAMDTEHATDDVAILALRTTLRAMGDPDRHGG